VPQQLNSSEVLPARYRFHPLVRWFMLLLSSVTAIYTLWFIIVLIPRVGHVSYIFKILSVIILYIAVNTLYKHLTALNTVIIRPDKLELHFLLRRNIFIPWDRLMKMDIYKVITHYWKIYYTDEQDKQHLFKTSLAFPGIMNILLNIQDRKPDLAMNELLTNVLAYKRKLQSTNEVKTEA